MSTRWTQSEPSYFRPASMQTRAGVCRRARHSRPASRYFCLLEIDARNGDSAAIGERLLLGLEIVTLESGAVTLCREGTIFHGMVDDGDSRLFGGKSFGPTKELASGN